MTRDLQQQQQQQQSSAAVSWLVVTFIEVNTLL